VSRPESAAPSVGSLSVHSEQQKALLQQAVRSHA
jgi:2-oxoglutarate dehydrogenase complex dehydrogenase (E1) component-like enzyme